MPADIKTILALEVPIVVRLGERSMTVRGVLGLSPGAIIELPKSAEDELDLLVNNRRIGHGTAVKLGENFGIRISSIGGKAERIQALAEPVQDDDSLVSDAEAEALAAALLAGQ